MKLDVRKPLRRSKSITLPNGVSSFVRFEYEKLSLFCFICGKLGHGESYCPLCVHNPQQEFSFQWNISLRAQTRRNQNLRSRWLVEEDGGQRVKDGNSRIFNDRRDFRNVDMGGVNQGNDSDLVHARSPSLNIEVNASMLAGPIYCIFGGR